MEENKENLEVKNESEQAVENNEPVIDEKTLKQEKKRKSKFFIAPLVLTIIVMILSIIWISIFYPAIYETVKTAGDSSSSGGEAIADGIAKGIGIVLIFVVFAGGILVIEGISLVPIVLSIIAIVKSLSAKRGISIALLIICILWDILMFISIYGVNLITK